jgi:multiple sugar transport system permease protein
MKSRTGRAARHLLGAAGYHLGLWLLCLVMIYPILWLVGSSLKPAGEIWTRVTALLPHVPTLENYVNGWRGFGGVSFAVYYRNTILYATVGTLAAIASSAVVAFGFARIKFPGKNIWFSCMIATLMLPTQIQIIPQYIMFNKIGWINSYSPLIVPRLFGQAFFIFMIMQFIRAVPRELDEAAEIDGCSRGATFFRIILPLLKPALFTAAIFSFYWTWSEFFTPLIYLNNPKIYTISLALRSFADPGGLTDWGAIFAMSFLSLLPVLALFVAFQRYLVQGIASTGLKG